MVNTVTVILFDTMVNTVTVSLFDTIVNTVTVTSFDTMDNTVTVSLFDGNILAYYLDKTTLISLLYWVSNCPGNMPNITVPNMTTETCRKYNN